MSATNNNPLNNHHATIVIAGTEKARATARFFFSAFSARVQRYGSKQQPPQTEA
jgi:hypothetical protein